MAMISRTTQCRGCGAEIAFIKTVNGKSIPVDPEAVCFFQTDKGPEKYVMPDGTVERGRKAEAFEETRIGYISHFSTCPKADSFRRR